MKRLLFILWLLMAVSAFAADVKLAWDPMPAGETWTFVRIYERNATVDYRLVAEVPATATTATIPNVAPGLHTYIARSVNLWGESADSSPVTTPPVPTMPTGLKFTITVIISGTANPPE